MSYGASSETEKKPFFSLTFNLENMQEKPLLVRAGVWSALCKPNRVPAESPVELTGTLRHQQPASQPDNQSATLVCHLAKPGDWSCHSERVGPGVSTVVNQRAPEAKMLRRMSR